MPPSFVRPFARFLPLRLQIEAVQGHHLGPCLDEVMHEIFLRVLSCIEVRNRAQLRVGTKDQVDRSRRPLELLGGTITTFVDAFGG